MAETTPDHYLTLAATCTHEIKIKGSRFIALGFPISNRAEAESLLTRVRKAEHAATHHCYAWTAGVETETFKYSDDGEPSGTAGRPIYQTIGGHNLKNTLVVVVRYFGGVKLGTGGLTRAYAQAASELLDRAPIVEQLICDRLRFTAPFALYDRVMRLINTGGYHIANQDFGEIVTLEIEVRKSKTASFISQLTELSGGQIEISQAD